MKTQEATIYREIQRNTEMAITAIETISDKIQDPSLTRQIAEQELKYSELHNEAVKQLLQEKAEPYHSNFLAEAMLKTGIHCNTMLNTSTGHIAELMIKGSNMGILEMEKVLHHNTDAAEHAVSLGRELVACEEENVKTLKDYL